MYRKQMKFQRIICFLMLAASALVFVYSLGMTTDLYEAFYETIIDPTNLENTPVKGSRIFYDIQPFNKQLTVAAIVLIVLALVNFIINTHSRRKYYLANYITVALSSVANVAISVWAIINITGFRTQFLTTVDFEALKAYADEWGSFYTESTFWFDIGFVAFAILLVATVLAILNLVWKTILMKEEKRLIKEGLEG